MDDWEELPQDALKEFIEAVRDEDFADLFDDKNYDLRRIELPFYEGYYLYSLANQAMIPYLEMMYLSNGDDHHYLDGTIFPFQAMNMLTASHINADTVEDYLDFFFDNVFYLDQKIKYIRHAANTYYGGALAIRHHFNVVTLDVRRSVQYDEKRDIYTVKAPILHNGETLKAQFEVHENGSIEILHPFKELLLDTTIDDAAPSYKHPLENVILEENKTILKQSAEGVRLLEFAAGYGINIRVLAGNIRRGFSTSKSTGYIVVPGYVETGNPYQVLDLAGTLRKIELMHLEEKRETLSGNSAEYEYQNFYDNLDILLNLCKIGDECKNANNPDILKTLRRMGFGALYGAFKNNAPVEKQAEILMRFFDKKGQSK